MLRRLATVIAAALFGAILLSFGLIEWSISQQTPPHNREQPAKTENQNSRASQPVTNPITDKNQSKRKQEDNWYNTFADHAPDWFVAIFTGLLVYVTYRLVKSTNKLWEAGERQIKVAENAVNAAKRSADVAERALTLADRPWVDLRIEITGPLVFDPIEGCKIDIKLTLLNIGRSPAIGLGFFIELAPSIDQAISSHNKMIENTRFMLSEISFGHTRFPGHPLEEQIMLTATRTEIKTGMQENESKSMIKLYVVACAYYGLPTGGRFRYTSVNRAIFRKDSDMDFTPAGEYPIENLFLSSFNPGKTT
jgi:hypothetical protein